MFTDIIVRALADRAELAELVARQGLWIDERRFEETREMFTDDVEIRLPGFEARGATTLAEVARKRHEEYESTQHATTNLVIDLDGNTAAVRAGVQAVFKLTDGKSLVLTTARYRFDAERTDHGWRFTSIEVTPTSRTTAIERDL